MNRSRYCGPPDQYDYMGAMQFCNLFMLGLRAHHRLLDFGCGSLRLGRFAIQYLDAGNYYAIEPKKELIAEGIEGNHLRGLVAAKKPTIHVSNDCNLAVFKMEFDYIMAQSVFTHMPQKQIARTLRSAVQAMHEASLFVANYKHGTRDYTEAEWTQENITYTPKTMEGLVRDAGLVATPLHLVHTHLQTWLLMRRAV